VSGAVVEEVRANITAWSFASMKKLLFFFEKSIQEPHP